MYISSILIDASIKLTVISPLCIRERGRPRPPQMRARPPAFPDWTVQSYADFPTPTIAFSCHSIY